MKRLFALVSTLVLLLFCTGCGRGGGNAEIPSQEDIAHEQVEETVEVLPIGIPGEVSIVAPFRGGYIAQSYDPQDESAALSLLDSEGQVLWTYKIEGHSEGVIPVDNDLILLKGMKREFTALDANGHVLWSRQVGSDSYVSSQVYLPDHAGGVYFFGRDTRSDQCQRWHVTASGEIQGPKPYTEIPDCEVLSGWVGEDDEYWLEGISGGSDEPRWVVRLDENLRLLARFELKKNQYPHPAFFSEANRILLFGQAYRGSNANGDWQEYGCLYEIDYDCKQLHYKTFEGRVPSSVARLKDGRWAVGFYTREADARVPVYLYSADWKQETEVRVDYGFAGITALDDGGFAVIGGRLASGSWFVNSQVPKVDRIYSRYSAAGELLFEKTFYAKDSKSGYGMCVLATPSGRVLVG